MGKKERERESKRERKYIEEIVNLIELFEVGANNDCCCCFYF